MPVVHDAVATPPPIKRGDLWGVRDRVPGAIGWGYFQGTFLKQNYKNRLFKASLPFLNAPWAIPWDRGGMRAKGSGKVQNWYEFSRRVRSLGNYRTIAPVAVLETEPRFAVALSIL